MPKIQKKGKEVTATELKQLIVDKIKERHSMTVAQFTASDLAKSLNIDKNLNCYLTPSGSVSFPAFEKLCKELGLGSLTKETKVIRTVVYTLE